MAFIRTALQAVDCAVKRDNRRLLSGKFCWAGAQENTYDTSFVDFSLSTTPHQAFFSSLSPSVQRFIQYLASRNTLFNLNNFLDKGALQGRRLPDASRGSDVSGDARR